VQILGQVHDAILGQIPTEEVDTLVHEILKRMHNPLTVGKKEMIIPSDCEVGTNWKAMKKWRPRG
jgi:DNA polymerase I-like protein with 3'-5' exonuclease and polymerase domains